MTHFQPAMVLALGAALLMMGIDPSFAQDVRGYSVLKGRFLNQTAPETLIVDPDFGFSILAAVELTDFDLATKATIRLPGGARKALDNLSDNWSLLKSYKTLAELNGAYGWGKYTLTFNTVNDGNFVCLLPFPKTSLPPTPRLTNFPDVQAVDPTKPLILSWDYLAAPNRRDFVQVYIMHGHGEIFSTPDLGLPGALDIEARSLTIPAGTLAAGVIYALNLEITRLVATNSSCYTNAQGVTATFSSTSLIVPTLVLPELRLLSRPTNGAISLEVQAEMGKTVVLQASTNLTIWRDLATNVASTGNALFTLPLDAQMARFFRAWQQ